MENQGGFLFTLKILLEALLNMLCVYNMKKKNSVQRKGKEKKKEKFVRKIISFLFTTIFYFPRDQRFLLILLSVKKLSKSKDFRFIDFLTLIRYKVICL